MAALRREWLNGRERESQPVGQMPSGKYSESLDDFRCGVPSGFVRYCKAIRKMRLAVAALAAASRFGQQDLTQANVLRRHFDQLVFFDVFQSGFER